MTDSSQIASTGTFIKSRVIGLAFVFIFAATLIALQGGPFPWRAFFVGIAIILLVGVVGTVAGLRLQRAGSAVKEMMRKISQIMMIVAGVGSILSSALRFIDGQVVTAYALLGLGIMGIAWGFLGRS